MKNTLSRIAFRTSIVYWLIASLWILFSDRAVLMISSDPMTIGRLSMYKGWGFVIVTAALLYVMLRGQLSQVEKEAAARREAERGLRENEELYRTLVNTLPDAVTMSDLNGAISFVSPRTLSLYRYTSSEEILGRNILDWVSPDEREKAIQGLQQLNETGTLDNAEFTLQRKDGTRFSSEVSASTIHTDNKQKKGFIFVSRDVTARKKAEDELTKSNAQLRRLTAHLQSVREEERQRISRELHDELGQDLTALKMQAFRVNKTLSGMSSVSAEILEQTRAVLKIADGTIRSVRRIASELRPQMLDQLGIVEALQWQSSDFQKRSGIIVNFESTLIGLDKISDVIATAILRIFQEALTNVARHAEASMVSAQLSFADGMLHLEVTDDGRGITEQETVGVKSLGLVGISERARLLGGRTSITSENAKGTTVEAWIPLESQ